MVARIALTLLAWCALSTPVGSAHAKTAATTPATRTAAKAPSKPASKPKPRHAPQPAANAVSKSAPPSAATHASSPAAADTADCAAAAPAATLQAGVYPQQSFQRLPDNRAQETATLAKHVRLRIEYAGCADVLARTVTLRVDDPRRGHREPRVWAAFLGDTLQRLQAVPERRWFEPGLLRFLVEVSAQRGNPGPIERCADGSAPAAAECAFATGGGYRFDVRETKGSTTVIVRQYNWL